ncbi:helix-turn-helix domain-containing protein [Paenibacillus sp. strain BS8-2]
MYGERIRKLRKEKKLTMKQLGAKFNLAESTISGYENETRKPDLELIDKLADYFGVKADYILGRTDDPTPSFTPNKELVADSDAFSIAFLGGPKEVLDEEEAAHLEKQLEMFRIFREKRRQERGQSDK